MRLTDHRSSGAGNDFCQKITYRTGAMRVTDQVTDPDGTVREVAVMKRSRGDGRRRVEDLSQRL